MKLLKRKKIISILLTLALVIAVFPQMVFAAGTITLTHSDSDVTSNSAVVLITINYNNSGDLGKELYLDWTNDPYGFNGTTAPNRNTLTNLNTQSYPLTNLQPGTTYYVRTVLKYFDKSTNSDKIISYEDSFTTKSSASQVSVSGLTVATANDTTALAGAFYSANSSVTITRLGVVYSVTDANPSVNGLNTAIADSTYGSGGIITANMTNLTGSVYNVRAFVQYTENGTTKYAYSPVFTYTRADTGAPKVVTSSAGKTDNWIYAYGTISSVGNAALTDYGFVLSPTNNLPTLDNSSRVQGSFTSANVNFEGSFSLSSYSNTGTYYVRAYAVNRYGIAYGDVVTVNLSQQSARVLLQSVDFTGSDNAQVTIYVPSQGSVSLLERGVVLAKSPNESPAIDGSNVIIVNADKETGVVKTGEAIVSINNLEKNTTYYARAYVKTNTGTFYSADKGAKVETKSEEAVATLVPTEITNTTAIAGGKVAINLDYTIRARGVVYSKTNTIPEMVNSEYVQHEKAEPGEFTVELKNLTPNTTYYVRAYYQTVQGYTYGNVRSFKTDENYYTKINEIKDIKTNEATVRANVSSDINYNVTERGVIFSTTQTTPNINNSDYRAAENGGSGDFDVTLTNLTPNTKYYVRAYAKTSQGYNYSLTKDFTTTQNVTLKISYRLADGTLVGSEDITALINDVITGDKLKVPSGYALESSGFKLTVTGSDSLTVVVVAEGKVEASFTEGIGGYRFNPDVPMTRIDVVKMVYNLMGDGKTYESSVRFSDMPTDYASVNAINFTTSRGIISGYEDGTFGPNRGITRAELAVIIYKAFNLQPNNSINVALTDISSHWSRTYVTVAVQNGVILGYEDKTFKPDRQVTRAEAVTMLSNASGRSLVPLGQAEFTDVPSTHWAYRFIMNAAVPKP